MWSGLSPSRTRGITLAITSLSKQSFRPPTIFSPYLEPHLLGPYIFAPKWRRHSHQNFSSSSSIFFRHTTPKSSKIRTFSSQPTMEMNGETRTKRKQSPVLEPERPLKHLKPETSSLTPGDATPANGTVYSVENEAEAARLLPLAAAPADSPEWQATIERVVKSVVSIHFCQTCSFDTDLSMSSQATGFVVDAERGYILTNRHVACAGPFWGYCIFENHEEVCWVI